MSKLAKKRAKTKDGKGETLTVTRINRMPTIELSGLDRVIGSIETTDLFSPTDKLQPRAG